jgi:hypothetical protein
MQTHFPPIIGYLLLVEFAAVEPVGVGSPLLYMYHPQGVSRSFFSFFSSPVNVVCDSTLMFFHGSFFYAKLIFLNFFNDRRARKVFLTPHNFSFYCHCIGQLTSWDCQALFPSPSGYGPPFSFLCICPYLAEVCSTPTSGRWPWRVTISSLCSPGITKGRTL